MVVYKDHEGFAPNCHPKIYFVPPRQYWLGIAKPKNVFSPNPFDQFTMIFLYIFYRIFC